MIVQVRPRRRQTLREGIAVEQLPETILQFGGGSFLRAFADVFVHEANAAGTCVGRIVVVQSTEGNRATLLNAQGGKYHVVFRGSADGVEIDRTLAVRSISRALIAKSEWPEVLRVAQSPALRMVISNTTEAGYSLIDNDDPETPVSFPTPASASHGSVHTVRWICSTNPSCSSATWGPSPRSWSSLPAC